MLERYRQRAEAYRALAAYYDGQVPSGQELFLLMPGTSTEDVPEVSREAVHDYNRLFLGPQRLLAPPYESAYCNLERLTMQEETLSVRKAYAAAGIEIRDKNRIPDDHAAYEFFFLAWLMDGAIQAPTEADYEDCMAHHDAFLREHLLRWFPRHLEDVRRHASSDYCRRVGEAAERFITLPDLYYAGVLPRSYPR